ncbi:diguanylate cyclase [Micromonosporaceae bacterium Da 78-11]
MTLRGRLTTAFLVVVLGPVLLGSVFVAITVGTVSRDRTVVRLDHAASTVRTGIGAVCRQLQAAADAVAVVPAADRSAVADQLVKRGLASEIQVGDEEVRPTRGASGGGLTRAPTGRPAGWQDCAAPAAGPATTISASARNGNLTVTAAQTVDPAFLDRLTASSGADVTVTTRQSAGRAAGETGRAAGETGRAAGETGRAAGETGRAAGDNGRTADQTARDTSGPKENTGHTRRLGAEPGQPLPLTLTVSKGDPTSLYAVLIAVVLTAAAVAVLVARWLARSTTRPLGDLAWAADRVAEGDLDVRVPVPRPDELGRLATTFNRMTRELQAYVQALTASRDQLRGHLAILGETLSSTHDLHRILQVILRTALAATGARAGLVLLIDPKTNQLVARCGIGLTGDWDVPDADLPQRRLPVGVGALGLVASTGEPRRGQGTVGSAEPACLTYVAVPICAPATVDDPLLPSEPSPGTLGVLALYDRVGGDAFDNPDLHTLRTFAGQAGVAVHNVRVHEEAQRLSLTDPLTGLWNYRYLRESLRREVERASRFGRMLTVLVLDLDHFKDVNDTYGHAAGDTVLNEFARRMRIGLREVDVAFRQGGEEFVVLLPETDAFGGAIVAERLGAAVRERPVLIDPRRSDLSDRVSITVSIGIAVFPEHGGTAQQVLDAADDALYAAKNAGRDTYRLAETAHVIQSGVSPAVPDGHFDPAATATGGPQPPRQARGR